MVEFISTQEYRIGHSISGAEEIGGYAWEKTGKIWYVTLRDRLRENSDFQDTANLTFEVAGSLYGKGSREEKAIQNAWNQVGIEIRTTK